MKKYIQNQREEIPKTKFQRDISWLSFNERVLQEARDKSNPLFERLKFLGIYSKNIGEFFHVRMAYHLNLIRINKSTRKILNYSPKRLIKQIIQIANLQQIEFSRIINEEIKPELAQNDIYIKKLENLSNHQLAFVHEYFNDTLRIYAEPLLMRGKSVNPFLKDGSLYLGVLLKAKIKKGKEKEYGIVRIPSDILDRFIEIPVQEGGHDLIMLDDILRHGLPYLFPGFNIIGSYSFKMTRDAELYIEGNYSGSLKEAIRKSLKKRQVGSPARFVYDRNMPLPLLSFLTESFELKKYDKIKEGRYQNYHDLLRFPDFGKTELKNEKFEGLKYAALEAQRNVFNTIRNEDHFIHPPYHNFESVIHFFEFSSKDPLVKEIYITQYRIGDNSRILNALIYAAQNGKSVTVFLEVQARFDEQANLAWGDRLERAGVQVIYSIPGIKVHCKIGLVRRLENKRVKDYALLSTGNFHEANSTIYSDMCLFTAMGELCQEVYSIFQHLKLKPSKLPNFKHLLVGKSNLRPRLENLINQEMENARNGKKAYIIVKLNSLEDTQMINKLYEASRANVKIDLIIRGICCLIPGIEQMSENIRVISIIDRYLEHARVYYFYAAGQKKLYLSSADWMTRNLSRRIEAAFPVFSKKIKLQIIDILMLQLKDNVKARIVDAKHRNVYVRNNETPIQSQHRIYYLLKEDQNKNVFVTKG